MNMKLHEDAPVLRTGKRAGRDRKANVVPRLLLQIRHKASLRLQKCPRFHGSLRCRTDPCE